MKKYTEGYKLKDDEYLLKIRKSNIENELPTGFLTKLTQKGQLPIAFKEWTSNYTTACDLPIYVFKEEYRPNWKIEKWRFGKSQNWAKLIHPEGFIIEIYLINLLNIIKENTIHNGEIIGEFMWKPFNLKKK